MQSAHRIREAPIHTVDILINQMHLITLESMGVLLNCQAGFLPNPTLIWYNCKLPRRYRLSIYLSVWVLVGSVE